VGGNVKINGKKQAMRQIICGFLIIVSMTHFSFGQSKNLTLTKKNNNRTINIKVKPSTQFTIDYILNVDTISQTRTEIRKTGEIVDITPDSIILEITHEDIVTYKLDKMTYFLDTLSILKKDICRINVNKSGGNPFTTIGAIGIFTALIVAPLISIDYDSGEINEKKYFLVQSVSTLTSIISFSLIRFKIRSYWIVNKDKSENRLWVIE